MGEQVDGCLEYIERFVRAVFMEAVDALAAFDVDAEGLTLAVGTADVCVLCFAAAIQTYENAVVMDILIQQLLTHKAGNDFPVNVPLAHKVGIDAAHIVVGVRQSKGLRLCRGRLCLLIPFAIFSAQQK